MKKYAITLLIIILSHNYLLAQVDKEVEVTRTYVPVVERATKPHIDAEINEEATINPDLDYDITPLSINTPLKSKPINPAKVTYWEYNKPAMAQVKIGAGYPLNSLLQGVVSTHNASVGYLAAQIDHSGRYSKLLSHDGLSKQNATEVLCDASISAGLYLEEKLLSADFSYMNNSYHNYAFEQNIDSKIRYQSLGTSMFFGDSFVDMKRLNYALSADVNNYFDNKMNSTNSLGFNANFGKEISSVEMLFGAGYNRGDGGDTYLVNDYNIYAQASAQLLKLDITIGADYHRYNAKCNGVKSGENYIMPNLMIKGAISHALSVYAGFGGSIEDNSYQALSMKKPFIERGLSYVTPTYSTHLIGGIGGRMFSDNLSYDLNVRYQEQLNSKYWTLNVITQDSGVENAYFNARLSKLDILSINGELSYKPISSLLVSIDAHHNSFSEAEDVYCINNLPRFTSSIKAEYSALKFRCGIKAEYMSKRNYAINYAPNVVADCQFITEVLPSVVDLSVYADYRHSNKLSVFINGSNLLNESLYPEAIYRGFGASVTAGVKINFR